MLRTEGDMFIGYNKCTSQYNLTDWTDVVMELRKRKYPNKFTHLIKKTKQNKKKGNYSFVIQKKIAHALNLT